MNIKRTIKKLIGFNSIIESIEQNRKLEQEILCAIKFNNTIHGCDWFKNQNITPGGSAIDYAFFYTLFRVLTSIHPQNILEFGLGQSSKMVHQYANFYGISAITVEHDQSWIDFFNQSIGQQYPINTKVLDLSTEEYKGTPILTYKNCLQTFKEEKFDLILVDGPFGYMDNITYSRSQIINLAKECITSNFVIIIDDYDRQGEKNTVSELFSYFESVNINYIYKVYGSMKQHLLITTPLFHFLTTL